MGAGTVPAGVRFPVARPLAARTAHGILVAEATRGRALVAITVIGDGPAGLSAALFLAKNGHDVVVYGQDETAMHYAHLRNYLGVADIDGTEFQERAREQVARHGAELVEGNVTAVSSDGDGFVVSTEDGAERRSGFVVVAGAKRSRSLLEELGAEIEDGAPVLDQHYRTTVDGVYAVGRVARPERSQAIISAGAGAVAAVDILSRLAGEDVTDWDTPDDT